MDENKSKLPFMVFLFVAISFLDLLGIGLIAPYITLIMDPASFFDSQLFQAISFLNLPKEETFIIYSLSIFLILLFIFKAISAIFMQRFILNFCFSQSVRIRSTLMTGYQSMEYTDYVERNSSEYIYRMYNLSGQYATMTLSSLLRLISEGLVVMLIISFLAWTDFIPFVLLLGILTLVAFSYDLFFRKRVANYGKTANKRSTEMVQAINEGIYGLKEIRILGKEDYFHDQMDRASKESAGVTAKVALVSTIPRYLIEMILISFLVLLVVTSLFLGRDLSSLVATVGMFAVAAMRLAPSANQIINGITQIRFGRNGVDLLFQDLKNLSDLRERRNPTIDEKEDFQKLIIDKVSFTYPNSEKPSLQDISLEIEAGQSVGFMGPSGSGKTSLADLILGLLVPQKGKILFNNKALNNNLESWRSNIAYIPQEIFVIDGTLKSNIALGLEDGLIENKRLEKALSQSRLSELVIKLPQGVETILGERGLRLSGGQRQRVALARAFYHGRNVLVLDEATSALDNEVENEIVEEIRQLKGLTTTIVIAHRLSTLKHCDTVFKIEEGRIVGAGSFEEIIGE